MYFKKYKQHLGREQNITFLEKDDLKKKGKEFIDKLQKNYEFFSEGIHHAKEDARPVKKGQIPQLAVLLGLLDPFFFELYQMCDGKRDIATLSEVLDMDKESVKILIDKLVKNGLIAKPEDE